MPHIRIISPSGAIDDTYIYDACARLRAWGHEVSIGEHALGRCGRFAASDDERVSDYLAAVSDPSVDIILCSRGGYGLQRIIDRLPATDKLIVGFSDITALHLLQSRHGYPSLHGLMCKHIATLPDSSEALTLWRQTIAGVPLSYTLPPHPLNRCGHATAPLVGGNLSVLYGLQATPYSLTAAPLPLNGSSAATKRQLCCLQTAAPLLFIEDIAERHYHIDRMLNNLRLSGLLASLSGLIVGRFSDCEDDPGMRETIYETIRRYTDPYSYPVLFNFPAGHVEDNRPLLLGATVSLTVSDQSVELHYV